MVTKDNKEKNIHHGHAIKRFRHSLGIKQDTLAFDMGITQALISFYEQKKEIDDNMIEKFAAALNIHPSYIKELEEDPVSTIIDSNNYDRSQTTGINNNEILGQIASKENNFTDFKEINESKSNINYITSNNTYTAGDNNNGTIGKGIYNKYETIIPIEKVTELYERIVELEKKRAVFEREKELLKK